MGEMGIVPVFRGQPFVESMFGSWILGFGYFEIKDFGEVAEWLKARAWKAR